MNRPPGFVPVPYHKVGKLFLGIGGIGLIILIISEISEWFSLPIIFHIFSIASVFVGLYLVYIVPRET